MGKGLNSMWTKIFIYIVVIGLILAFGSLWWGLVSRAVDEFKGKR